MQFNKIYTQDDVVAPTTNKWGAHDEYALNFMCKNLNKQSSPFFAGLLTISLHEPFDVPFGQPDTMSTSEQKFCNAAKYTDKCLQHFFATSALQPWFQNTVLILVADHGHNLPLNRHYFDIATHHIGARNNPQAEQIKKRDAAKHWKSAYKAVNWGRMRIV